MTTPRNGFQKYHDLKSSFAVFGLGFEVVLQFEFITGRY